MNRDFDSEVSEFTDSESEDDVDNVHNVQNVVVDLAAENDAGNQGPPDTIPSNISSIRRF